MKNHSGNAKKSLITRYEPWPALPYDEFQPTAHLLHMVVQMIGKLNLTTPFEPEWANVILNITSRGLSSGLIPYAYGAFTITLDFISHEVICTSSWGERGDFKLEPMSVAEFHHNLFYLLNSMGIDIAINNKPQEIPVPISFDQDTNPREYNAKLANAWWRILLSTYNVMRKYHALFTGKTQPIGFMWGTFDIRDVRYNGNKVPTDINFGYITRNAFDEACIECGFWHGDADYPRPAFYCLTYPQPKDIELSKILPASAHWDNTMSEFILDYDNLRTSNNPGEDLLDFFQSTYKAGAEKSGWDAKLIGSGTPI